MRWSDVSQRTGLYPDRDANLGARFAVHTCGADIYFPSTDLNPCANIDSSTDFDPRANIDFGPNTDAHTHRPNLLTGG